jgi:hypothetical protein
MNFRWDGGGLLQAPKQTSFTRSFCPDGDFVGLGRTYVYGLPEPEGQGNLFFLIELLLCIGLLARLEADIQALAFLPPRSISTSPSSTTLGRRRRRSLNLLTVYRLFFALCQSEFGV